MRRLISLSFAVSLQAMANPPLDDAFMLRMQPCFGTCPVYTATLFKDGTLIFDGEAFVASQGLFKTTRDPALYSQIVALSDYYSFNQFNDDYQHDEKVCSEVWTDHPATWIRLQFAGKSKSVYHYHGCRGFAREAELLEFEQQVEVLLDLDGFIGKNQ